MGEGGGVGGGLVFGAPEGVALGGHFEGGFDHLGVTADEGVFGEFGAGLFAHASDFGGEEFAADFLLDVGVFEGAGFADFDGVDEGDVEAAAVFDDFGDLSFGGSEDGFLDFFEGEGSALDFADVSGASCESGVVVHVGGEGGEVFAFGDAVADADEAVEGLLFAAVAGGVDADHEEGGFGLFGEEFGLVVFVVAAHVGGGGVGDAGSDFLFVVELDEVFATLGFDHFFEVFAVFGCEAFGVFEGSAGFDDAFLSPVDGECVGEFAFVGGEAALCGGVFEFFGDEFVDGAVDEVSGFDFELAGVEFASAGGECGFEFFHDFCGEDGYAVYFGEYAADGHVGAGEGDGSGGGCAGGVFGGDGGEGGGGDFADEAGEGTVG